MNENIMYKYKKMIIWSAGNEKASIAKLEFILSVLASIICCGAHVLFFVANFHDDKSIPMTIWDHICCGMLFSVFMSLITLCVICSTIDTFKNIKLNKLIPIYLYEIDEFVKLGNIPEDKFVLFSDERGIVLAENKYKKESKYCCNNIKYFHEIEDYYEKYTGEKYELHVCLDN